MKNYCKPVVIRAGWLFWYQRIRYWLLFSPLLPVFIWYGYPDEPEADVAPVAHSHSAAVINHPGNWRKTGDFPAGAPENAPADTKEPDAILIDISDSIPKQVNKIADDAPDNTPNRVAALSADVPDKAPDRIDKISADMPDNTPEWVDIKIRAGDSLARIFSRLGLSLQDLHRIMALGRQTSALKRLQPGQIISFREDAGGLQALRFELDLTRSLLVTKAADKFTSEIILAELETRVEQAEGIISDSFYLSGKAAGLSDNLIMQLIDIYGWDIDFIMDIRKGDSFKVIYEEKYRNLEKVTDGPVLAAEFTNRGRTIRAARYEREDGQVDYYSDTGHNMRKAFLKTPLKFSRISSHFNLRRKHPLLNRVRAHKGVDYAARTGTPIKVTGDGIIHYAGNKGGYGRTVIVKHGGKYSTLYAHLSRYGKGIRRGRSVKQGQIIGYVGQSGLATGPHLHYEFRVHGVHRNPLTVPRPKAEGIPATEMDEFKTRTSRLFALLDTPQINIAGDTESPDTELLALSEESLQNSF